MFEMIVKENRFKYMNRCPVDGKPLGQTKICPEHRKSEFTIHMKFLWTPEKVFVDPGMA